MPATATSRKKRIHRIKGKTVYGDDAVEGDKTAATDRRLL